MNEEVLRKFDNYVAIAQWFERKGDQCINKEYYDEAFRWFDRAEEEYKKAYDLAEKCGDDSKKIEVSTAQSEVERKKEYSYSEGCLM